METKRAEIQIQVRGLEPTVSRAQLAIERLRAVRRAIDKTSGHMSSLVSGFERAGAILERIGLEV